MFFLPLGIEGGEVRFPFVGLGILLLCVALFIPSWVLEDDPMGTDEAAVSQVVEYWSERPYLELTPAFRARFKVTRRDDLLSALGTVRPTPSPELVASEQEHLTGLCERALTVKETWFRMLSLQPSRGLPQLGLITHLFIHAGWLHLIGNMLFLYAVALVLEDAWGKGLFAAFYLLGGIVAALAQYAMMRGSETLMMGASGAVAACIGAATVRFASRRMRVGYLLFLGFSIRRGIFSMPMWLWGVFKAGSEVYNFATGSAPGVAVMAHIGGLGFGIAVALGMKAVGLDRTLLGMDEAGGPLVVSELADVEAANAALRTGNKEQARALFEKAAKEHPGDVDAEWGLLGLDLSEGYRARAVQRLERVMQSLLRDRQAERATTWFLSVWPGLQPQDLKPSFAWSMAKALESTDAKSVVRQLYRRAAEEPSALAPRALLRAAELALADLDGPEALELLELAKALPLPRELADRVTALIVSAEELSQRGGVALDRAHSGPFRRDALPPEARSGLALSLPGAPPASSRPLRVARQVMPGSVQSARADGLTLVVAGGATRDVPFSSLKHVAAGLVRATDGHVALVVVLVLGWGDADGPTTALRIDSDSGGAEKLQPQLPPLQAWMQFVRWLFERSGASTTPSLADAIAGALTRYDGLAQFEEAVLQPPSNA